MGNAKFEIYKETKITAEEKLMKISVFKEKKRNEIPLGYVIKLRNEQQGS